MGRRVVSVTDLATYYKRESDFRRSLPLVDDEVMLSLDIPETVDSLQFQAWLHQEVPRTPEWEIARIKKVAGMLPKRLKRYQKVLWAIYHYSPRRREILKVCRLNERTYRRIFLQFWWFVTRHRALFERLTAIEKEGVSKKIEKSF